jgi:uncharacterized DUF497 family protein
MEFEWDPEKAASNLANHGVTFQGAATVLGDPLSLTFYDPDHSLKRIDASQLEPLWCAVTHGFLGSCK